MFFPLAMLSQYIFGPALFLISTFIVLIILLQRGRGGGLTGALGGAGGASAFGVKAGDIFTRITAGAVLLWIVLCAVTCYWYITPPLVIPSSGIGASSTGAGELNLGNGADAGKQIPSESNLPGTPNFGSEGIPTEQPATPGLEPGAPMPPQSEVPFAQPDGVPPIPKP